MCIKKWKGDVCYMHVSKQEYIELYRNLNPKILYRTNVLSHMCVKQYRDKNRRDAFLIWSPDEQQALQNTIQQVQATYEEKQQVVLEKMMELKSALEDMFFYNQKVISFQQTDYCDVNRYESMDSKLESVIIMDSDEESWIHHIKEEDWVI